MYIVYTMMHARVFQVHSCAHMCRGHASTPKHRHLCLHENPLIYSGMWVLIEHLYNIIFVNDIAIAKDMGYLQFTDIGCHYIMIIQ